MGLEQDYQYFFPSSSLKGLEVPESAIFSHILFSAAFGPGGTHQTFGRDACPTFFWGGS